MPARQKNRVPYLPPTVSISLVDDGSGVAAGTAVCSAASPATQQRLDDDPVQHQGKQPQQLQQQQSVEHVLGHREQDITELQVCCCEPC